MSGVLAGVDAAIGATPIVRLGALAKHTRVPVLVKCEHMNPGGSVKDRLALALLDDGEQRGGLAPGATLVEATAGNTGMGLAMLAARRGYRLVCVMPEKMSHDKRFALRALGAEVVITPNAPPSSPENFRNVAERLANERGWHLTDQFRSEANVRIHERTTAREILDAVPDLGAFVAGVGTGGTIMGVGRVLARERPSAKVVLADPIGSALADWVETGTLGADGSYAVEGIGGSVVQPLLDRAFLHAAERVSDEESFETARRLAHEEGLFVGGSAGTNVAAALRVACRSDVSGPVVTVLPDGLDRYRSQPWMQRWAERADA
jgi:cysteine synthase